MNTKTFARTGALLAAAALALTGCASAESGDGLTVTDPWVRAEAGEMTAMFGEIVNDTGTDLHIASIETDVAETVEMHEMVMGDDGSMIMQEFEGGFTLPAGETFVLDPGGDHFMLIGLLDELKAGEVVTLTVNFDEGDPLVIEATVKDFEGGNEPYHEDGEGEHGDDEHGDH